MKKLFRIVLVLILFLAIRNDIYSQSQKLKFGFYAGGGFTNYSVNYDYGIRGIDTSYISDIRFTYNICAFLKYDFVKNFSLKAEAQFLKQGGSFSTNKIGSTDSLTPVTRKYSSYVDYIKLDLLPQLNILISTDAAIFVNTGGYLAFRIGSSQVNEETSNLQYRTYEQDISNNLKVTDAGLTFGLGMELKSDENIGIMIGMIYNLGLQNILDVPDIGNKIKIRNNSITFNVGIIGM
jgi:hypothetical protein